MKLEISPPLAVPVCIPFTLRFNEFDQAKMRLDTFSDQTSHDGGVQFGPEDFSNDDQKRGILALAAVLRDEAIRKAPNKSYTASDAIVPGKLVIDAQYTVEQEAVNAAVNAALQVVVERAGEQYRQIADEIAAFETWSQTMHQEIPKHVSQIARNFEQSTGGIHGLQDKVAKAVLDLDTDAIDGFEKQLAEWASYCPVFEEQIEKSFVYVVNAVSKQTGVHPTKRSISTLASMRVDERRASERTEDGLMSVAIEASFDISNEAGVPIFITSLTITSGYQAPVRKVRMLEIPELKTAMRTAAAYGRLYKPNPLREAVPARSFFSGPMTQIINKKRERSERAWVADYGSAELKQGHALGYTVSQIYREERARSVIKVLYDDIPEWTFVADVRSFSLATATQKAGPSVEALRLLTAIRPAAPTAIILNMKPAELDTINGEVIYIPVGELFEYSFPMILFRRSLNTDLQVKPRAKR